MHYWGFLLSEYLYTTLQVASNLIQVLAKHILPKVHFMNWYSTFLLPIKVQFHEKNKSFENQWTYIITFIPATIELFYYPTPKLEDFLAFLHMRLIASIDN